MDAHQSLGEDGGWEARSAALTVVRLPPSSMHLLVYHLARANSSELGA